MFEIHIFLRNNGSKEWRGGILIWVFCLLVGCGGVNSNYTVQTWTKFKAEQYWDLCYILKYNRPAFFSFLIFFFTNVWSSNFCNSYSRDRKVIAICFLLLLSCQIFILGPVCMQWVFGQYFKFGSKELGSTSPRIYGTVPSWTMILICIKLYSRFVDFTKVSKTADPSPRVFSNFPIWLQFARRTILQINPFETAA